MGVIFYASSQPYEEQDVKPILNSGMDLSFFRPYIDWVSFTYHRGVVSVEQLGTAGFIEFFIRKGAHVAAFAILFLFLFYAFAKTVPVMLAKLVWFSFLITVLYACSDEFHQSLTPNRTPYAGDVILDSIGAILAVFILYLTDFPGLCRRKNGKFES